MKKTVIGIDGMMCGMCEAHVSDVIRKNFAVKKVTASHVKGVAEVISENGLDEKKIKATFEPTGYRVLFVSEEEYEKKGLFSFFKKK